MDRRRTKTDRNSSQSAFSSDELNIWKISATIHEIGKIKALFGLGMTPIKNDKAVEMAK